MDYLSGRINKPAPAGADKKAKSSAVSEKLAINDLCESIINSLGVNELKNITDKYLTSDVISIFKNADLMECINAFFMSDLNISETSRNAFLHRNTLLYRIEKVNKLTGLNIRTFNGAVSFKLLSIIYDMQKKK